MGKGIEASKAGVVSTIEVAVAVMVSVVFFRETIDFVQLIGIMLVFVSIFMLNTKKTGFPIIEKTQK